MAKTSRRDKRRPAMPVIAPETPPSPSGSSLPVLETTLITVGLVALSVFVFGQVVRFDFVNLDDPVYVSDNPHVAAGLTWAGVAWAFSTGTAGNWHPLTWLSHMLDVQLYGMEPGPHHVTSLVIHILNSLFLLALLVRLSGPLFQSAFVAALFAVHPLHVESVAWISERKDVLSTLFWLLATWRYVSYVRAPTPRRYGMVAFFFALGLMTKPMVVTLPALLLLLDVWPLRRLPLTPLDGHTLRRLIAEKTPLLGLAIVASVVTIFAQRQVGTVASLEILPLGARLANALAAYATYLQQMLWPVGLAAFYPYPETPSTIVVTTLGLLLLAASVVAVALVRKAPYVFTGWFWFLGTLVPAIGLVQVGNQASADRYTYVPLIGLFLLITRSYSDLSTRSRALRIAQLPLAVVALVACALSARQQTQTWANSETLWRHALRVTKDNYYAHGAIGPVLADQNRLAEAVSHMSEALRLKPGLAEVHLDLGEVSARQGKQDEAAAHFLQAVNIDPGFAEAHHNLGVARSNQGQFADAVAHLQEALRLKPGVAGTHRALGIAFARQGLMAAAVRELLQAVRLDPRRADVRFELALSLQGEGKTAQAIEQLQEALRIDAGNVPARRMLEALSNGAAPVADK